MKSKKTSPKNQAYQNSLPSLHPKRAMLQKKSSLNKKKENGKKKGKIFLTKNVVENRHLETVKTKSVLVLMIMKPPQIKEGTITHRSKKTIPEKRSLILPKIKTQEAKAPEPQQDPLPLCRCR